MDVPSEPELRPRPEAYGSDETGPGLAALIDEYLHPTSQSAGHPVSDIVARRRPRPYPGLRSFKGSERQFFFSRERQVDELLTRVAARPVTMVLGGSGSGKSSLLRAGLLPRISGLNPIPTLRGAWYAAASRPETTPLTGLAEAIWNDILVNAWRLPRTRPVLLERLGFPAGHTESDEDGVARAAISKIKSWLLPDQDAEEGSNWGLLRIQEELLNLELHAVGTGLVAPPNLLVVIDQFEEIFREGVDPAERAALLDLIKSIHRDKLGAIRLILVMRSEDTHRCAQESLLSTLLNERLYYVRWLSRKELHNAIVLPARKVFAEWGVAIGDESTAPFDRKLVKELLREVGELRQAPETSADHLPLLAHALEAIWDTGLRRFADAKGELRPRSEPADFPGCSLIECLQLRAQAALNAAQRDQTLGPALLKAKGRAGVSSTPISRLPTSQMALRAAFCELCSLDENRRIYRGFRHPLGIAVSRFDTSNEALCDAIEASLQAFEIRGDLVRGASGFDVSHEALPRNWRLCEKWLRSDADAADTLIAAGSKDTELSPSEATAIDRLLHKTFAPQSSSWLRAATADALFLKTGDPAAAQIRAQNIIDNATRRYVRFRRKRRMQRGVLAATVTMVALLVGLGSIVLNMEVRERLTASGWIASQYAGTTLPQSVAYDANELAAATSLAGPTEPIQQLELAIAHWFTTWVPFPLISHREESFAWGMLIEPRERCSALFTWHFLIPPRATRLAPPAA